MPRGVRRQESMLDADDEYVPAVPEKGRGKRRVANGTETSVREGSPSAADEVNITVHFPVARIKRIMQADDDVGKVADGGLQTAIDLFHARTGSSHASHGAFATWWAVPTNHHTSYPSPLARSLRTRQRASREVRPIAFKS